MKNGIFTSEHVSPGHPDKVMDTIAEALVDYHLSHSLNTPRIAIDGLVKNNRIILAGEITSDATNDYTVVVQEAIKSSGYTPSNSPEFNHNNFRLETIFTEQSPDIAQGVGAEKGDNNEGAGDIGIMFGGAVNEAPDYTCWSHYLARLISYKLFKDDNVNFRPDQKTQVSILYKDGVPVKITDIVVCISHSTSIDSETLTNLVADKVADIIKELHDGLEHGLPLEATYTLFVNPTGKFEIFGPVADSGLVGRKIVCDQYGGFFPVGGGNLNGKDSTKVDRSAVYMARFVAKAVVSNALANKCQIQVAYMIGRADPVSINVETFGTEIIPIEEIEAYVNSFSFRPGDIIRKFELSETTAARGWEYKHLGMYGHIGERFNGVQIPWEQEIVID